MFWLGVKDDMFGRQTFGSLKAVRAGFAKMAGVEKTKKT